MSKAKLLKHNHQSIDIFLSRGISFLLQKMPLLISLTFSLAALLLWHQLKLHEQNQIHRKTELEASTIKFELNNEIQERILALVRTGKRWESREKPTQEEWEKDTELYIRHFGSYQAIEWVDSEFVVRWIVPKSGNEAAQNLKFTFDKHRHLVVLTALQMRQAKITGTVTLVQGGKGFLVCVPLFREEKFEGFIVGVFHNQKLFDKILHPNITQGYEVAIFDNEELIYWRSDRDKKAKQEFLSQWRSVNNKWIKQEIINLSGLTLDVQVRPSNNLLATEQSSLPEVALIAGMLTAFLLAITVYLAQKTQTRKRQLEQINQQLKQQITERLKSSEKILQSQKQYESLVNWIEGIVWEVDAETFQFTFVSQKAERLLGYPLEKWIKEPNFWNNHIHPDDREWAVEFCLINSQQKRDYEFEYRMIAIDGRIVWLRDIVNVVIKDNKLVKLRGVMIDITAYKQAQSALQESEERWQLALRGNNDGIWDWNIKTNEVFFSSRWKEMLGYADDEISNHLSEWEKRVHPDDLVEVKELIQAHFAKEAPFYISEHRVLCKDGNYKWILDRGQVLWDEKGHPIRMAGSHTDITDRKHSEKALQESQHFIQRIADATPSILYIYDLKENRNVYVNNEISVILGYTPEEIQNTKESLFEKLWHPDDLAALSERIKRFDKAKDGEVIETEYRLKHRWGEWRWFYSRDTIFSRSPEGKPWQILGTATDITKRKQMEEALYQANEEFKGWVNELEQRNQEIIRLGELSDVLQACLTVEEAYKVIAQMLQPLFPNMSGGIFITSSSRKLVEAVAVWEQESENFSIETVRKIDYSLDYRQISFPDSFPSQQLFSPHECWSLRRGRSHFTSSKNSGLVCKHIHTRPAESLCVPMMAQGEALGILYLSTQQPNKITEAKQILAATVAEHIALALANLRLRETLQNQSIRDPLTGLFNRRYLEESLERELHRSAKARQNLGVMMLDVDHFKKFNDTFGHDAGDLVLRELGIFLQKNTRVSDITCRYGGEEFTLIMLDVSLADLQERSENLRQGVKCLNLQYHSQYLGGITLSIGVAIYPEHGITGEELIQAADAALYIAKKQGRDRVSISH
ncbi:PAS domain-containing protein [Aerosakkonemataceae cyanobacterium BLCC-F154]|uniref:PAS domain-containing protein n=1 Tax=Floridaenema fluviatile BLCC-F154 TaxID=3153640 RepID=A0ABV4YJL8_9CYAN